MPFWRHTHIVDPLRCPVRHGITIVERQDQSLTYMRKRNQCREIGLIIELLPGDCFQVRQRTRHTTKDAKRIEPERFGLVNVDRVIDCILNVLLRRGTKNFVLDPRQKLCRCIGAYVASRVLDWQSVSVKEHLARNWLM